MNSRFLPLASKDLGYFLAVAKISVSGELKQHGGILKNQLSEERARINHRLALEKKSQHLAGL